MGEEALSAFRLRLFFDYPAVEEVNHAVGMSGKSRVVGDHENGRSAAVKLV